MRDVAVQLWPVESGDGVVVGGEGGEERGGDAAVGLEVIEQGAQYDEGGYPGEEHHDRQVGLDPEVEANLAAQARARGIPLAAYLQGVIEDLAKGENTEPANLEEFRATLDRQAEMGRDLPQIPLAELSRERMYQDRG